MGSTSHVSLSRVESPCVTSKHHGMDLLVAFHTYQCHHDAPLIPSSLFWRFSEVPPMPLMYWMRYKVNKNQFYNEAYSNHAPAIWSSQKLWCLLYWNLHYKARDRTMFHRLFNIVSAAVWLTFNIPYKSTGLDAPRAGAMVGASWGIRFSWNLENLSRKLKFDESEVSSPRGTSYVIRAPTSGGTTPRFPSRGLITN